MKHNIFVYEGVLFSAFRYALGRQTYVVSEVTEALEENALVLTDKLRHQMMNEIQTHLRSNGSQDEAWQHALKVLGEVDDLDEDYDDDEEEAY